MEDNDIRGNIVNLSDERLIEILNIENAEYTEEALSLVKEELNDRGFKDFSIDKGKKSISLRELILQVRYEEVQRILRKVFHVDKNLDEKYRAVFIQLLSITPSHSENINIIVDKHYDELTNTTSDWDVYGFETNIEEKFSVDLYNWNDWLSFSVTLENVNNVGKDLFVACCILKMTTHGFSSEEINIKYEEIASNPTYMDTIETYSDSSIEDRIEVHPWIRYWARTIDIMLFTVLSGYFIALAPIHVLRVIGGNEYIISLFLWVIVEALLISTWGSTPGKFLLGIIIRDNDGNKLSFTNSINRSASVWFFGMGCGISFIELIANFISYKRLSDKGMTRWDQNGKYQVVHTKLSMIKIIIAIIVLIGIPVLNVLSRFMKTGNIT